VSANISGLAAGTHNGTIQVSATGATGSPQSISVTLTLGAGPALLLGATSLSFSGTAGGSNPASQNVSITNTGGGTLNWTASVTSGGAWLGVSPGSGSGAGTLTVSANISGLAAGTYNGTIQVSATGATGSPQNISVTLTLAAPPSLSLSANSLSFGASAGGAPPASQSVNVINSGGGTLNWTASVTSGAWLSVSPASGTAPATLAVSVDISGLAAGTYNGNIQVAAAGVAGSPQSIGVTLTITSGPILSLAATSLVFSATQGGANPASQPVALNNTGGGTLNWTASVSSGAWLSVSPASGINAATLTVAVNIAGLAPGTHNGAIQVNAAGAAGSPQTISVRLTVAASGTPVIAASSTAVAVAVAMGENPQPLSVQVQNAGTGVMNWTAVAQTDSGGNWLAISPTSGTAPANVTVTMTPGGVAAGLYTGRIVITVPGAANSPFTIAVTLAVGAPQVGDNGVVNGASFSRDAVVAFGSIASLFGVRLAPPGALAVATQLPLPVELAGTRVLVNEVAAALFFVSPQQINFLIPPDLPAGTAQVQVAVISNGVRGLTGIARVAAEVPGIFTATPGGTGPGAVLNQDFSLNTATNPAAAGSIIQIFATGLGPVDPPVAAGRPAGSDPPSRTLAAPVVLINGVAADVLFSGLAPGFVGLYQVNARVPAATPAGAAVSLQIQIGGRSSNQVTIAVR
jgi:uncharacterized protein (TIGR03437 family)